MLVRKIYLAFYLLSVLSAIGRGQVYYNEEIVVESKNAEATRLFLDQIEIIGNAKTKAEIIVRELLFAEKDSVSLAQMMAAQKRVQSLRLFTQVRFDIIGEKHFAVLIISVYEQWYIFPIPIFYRNERNWKKLSYGGSLLYYNFLGRNILLNFTAAFGYNPEYKMAYFNPWFFGKYKLFTNFKIFKSKVGSLSLAFTGLEDQRTGMDWLIGKRFGHFTYVGLTLNYMEIKASRAGLVLSPSGIDKLPSLSLLLQFDNADLKDYPHRGWNLSFLGKRAGNNLWLHYYLYGYDFRRYQPLTTQTTLAVRCAGFFSSGKIPVYDRFYFGYEERIRGHFYDIVEGENLLFNGVEFRFPLLKIRYLDLPALPGLESYSHHLKFGLSVGIFVETGAAWFQNHQLTAQDFITGFGAGLHFHVPYFEVLRFDCGSNGQGEIQAIVELGIPF